MGKRIFQKSVSGGEVVRWNCDAGLGDEMQVTGRRMGMRSSWLRAQAPAGYRLVLRCSHFNALNKATRAKQELRRQWRSQAGAWERGRIFGGRRGGAWRGD